MVLAGQALGPAAVVPALLFLLALALRLWGIRQGYPDFYGHVDEIGVAASIWNLFRSGTLEPTEFTYPAFYQYLVAAGIWLTGAVGLADLPAGGRLVDRLAFLSYADPAWSALVGRGLSALASAASVVVVYRVGMRVQGPAVALAGGLGLAVAVACVGQARHALPDSTAGLLGALVMAAAWSVHERGAWRDYLSAGLCCGLLLATKYNGALCALAVVAAHVARADDAGRGGLLATLARALLGRRLWAAGAAALAATAAASPYLVLAWDRYLDLARYQVSSLDFTLRETSPWWWIPKQLATQEMAVGGMMLAGVAVAAWRRQGFDRLVLAAVVPAFLYIGSWTRESLHYLLPYYPLLAVAGARLLGDAYRRSGGGPALAAAAVLLLAPNLWTVTGQARTLAQTDTRAVAAHWIEAHVPAGSTLGMTWLPYCPRLQQVEARERILAAYAGRPDWQQQLRDRWAGRPAYRVVNLEVWLRRPLVPEALRDDVDLEDPETRRVFSRSWRSPSRLRAAGVTHVVLPEAVYRRYLTDGEPPEGLAAKYRYLLNQAYFRRLIEAPATERIAHIPASQGRGSAIAVYRLLPVAPEP